MPAGVAHRLVEAAFLFTGARFHALIQSISGSVTSTTVHRCTQPMYTRQTWPGVARCDMFT